MRAIIHSTSAYLPKKRMSNDELSRFIDTSDEWIRSHTGITYRHIAADDETASDMGIKASLMVLERTQMDPKELDLIICPTSTPDHPGFPSTACIIQGTIGATNAGAFDMSVACSGFVYALEIGRSMILNRSAKNILIVASEIMSRTVNWKDRNTCVLFGDGAGAIILSAYKDEGNRGILYSILCAEGEGSQYLKLPFGGSKNSFQNSKDVEEKDFYLQMNGQKVYNFATRAVTSVIKNILKENNITINEIKYIVPHQANVRIIESVSKRLKIPLKKFFINISEFANTTAATIPIALNEMREKKLVKENDLILTVGFGGGLTYGGNLIRW